MKMTVRATTTMELADIIIETNTEKEKMQLADFSRRRRCADVETR